MQISIKSVVVKERVRKDLGDLTPLMDSMRQYGQLTPIILTRRHELIAGHRRLLSAKRLGWHVIEAVYIDRESEADKLEIELMENVQRKDFSPEELMAGMQRLEKLRRPSLWRRICTFWRKLFARLFRRKPKPLPRAAMAGVVGAYEAGEDSEAGIARMARGHAAGSEGERSRPDRGREDENDAVLGVG